MTGRELIAKAKGEEFPEDVFGLLDSPILCALIAAWPKVFVDSFAPSLNQRFDSYADAWDCSLIQLHCISDAMGFPDEVCASALRQAISLRLIHLDGTVHQYAQIAVRTKVRLALGVKTTQPKREKGE